MRKKKVWLIGILAILFTVLLLGCTPDEGDRIFDEIVDEIDEPDEQDNREDEAVQEIVEDVEYLEIHEYAVCPDDVIEGEEQPRPESLLSGHLTILTNEFDTFHPILANYFMALHPNVVIEIERMEEITDIAQKTALATRLLAEPPDILNTANLLFEKFAMDALFIDLNELIDGPGGVNRGDFFDNIFRGAEIEGGLYHLPLVISTETVLLNKSYFASIGVPIADMRMMTFDEYLDFYLQAVERYPEDDIFVSSRFHIMLIFEWVRTYDIATGSVYVNTPEMRERLELVHAIPLHRDVEITPERIHPWILFMGGASSAVDPSFFAPTANLMYHWAVDLFAPFIFFLQDHPDMRFSHPVHKATEAGEIRFRSVVAPAITRESANQELAWEFLRFCMEFSESLYQGIVENLRIGYEQGLFFPVNRSMFEDQLRIVLAESYDTLVRHGTLTVSGDAAADAMEREAQIEYSLFRYKELIEMLNLENRVCEVILNSLIYPDIYLFITEQQDVDRTLENIQNRLELYVAE